MDRVLLLVIIIPSTSVPSMPPFKLFFCSSLVTADGDDDDVVDCDIIYHVDRIKFVGVSVSLLLCQWLLPPINLVRLLLLLLSVSLLPSLSLMMNPIVYLQPTIMHWELLLFAIWSVLLYSLFCQ